MEMALQKKEFLMMLADKIEIKINKIKIFYSSK
jgi:hypothetical protein